MSIYSKPVKLLMHEMAKDLCTNKEKVFSKNEAINWFQNNYPKIKRGTVSAHLIRLSVNAPSRIHYNAEKGQDDLFFQINGSQFRLYDMEKDPSPIYFPDKSVNTGSTETDDDSDKTEEIPDKDKSSEFAFESDLNNFLAKNLILIEPNLKLYEDEGINGIEFPAGGRFIDILALDANNDFVVIELKVSRGYDRVIGQLLRYMAWIKKNQAEPAQNVRGIIIAREISEDLMLATSGFSNISLFEYSLAISLRPIKNY